MKTKEILKTRKAEIIEKTLKLMPQALSGDRVTRTFYFEENNGELKIDYFVYRGYRQLSDNCFYTVKDYETPNPDDYGYESIEEIDFEVCGFDEGIRNAIENHIDILENN